MHIFLLNQSLFQETVTCLCCDFCAKCYRNIMWYILASLVKVSLGTKKVELLSGNIS